MDNEKLDSIMFLLEHMDKNINARLDRLEQGQQEMKQDISILKNNLGVVMEALNTTTRELNSKIATVDKKVNIVAADILELRAAQ